MREHEPLVVCFDGKFSKFQVSDVSRAESKLNEHISLVLNGELVLHADEDEVDGYTYITDDLTEVRNAVFISHYLNEEIKKLRL